MSAEKSLQELGREELLEDATFILKEAMGAATTKLEEWESKGYFQSAQQLQSFLDLVIVNSQKTTTLKPMGLGGLYKATKDKDVQMGLALVVEILKTLGRASAQMKAGSSLMVPAHQTRRNLNAMLAPRLSQGPLKRESSASAPVKSSAGSAQLPSASINPDQWNRELCLTIAKEISSPDLTEKHWELIEFCRKEYLSTQATPNMRRLSTGTGLSTKEIYTLFPVAPAKTVAKLAGCPKPAGCI